MKQLICTVTNDLSYDQRMIRICTSLAEAGWNVLLIGRKRQSSIPLDILPFQQKRITCFFQNGFAFYAEYNLRLLLFLCTHPFDVLCSIDLDTLVPGYMASKLKGKPLVFDAHEYFTEVPEIVNRPRIKQFWSTIARFIIPRLTYCYTVSETLAEILSQRYGPKFSVIRNVPVKRAVKQRTAAQSTKIAPPIILYQGALNQGRGLETMIRAMQHLNQVELWLAGEGDLSESLRQLARDLRVEHQINFLGYLPPESLKALTPQATIGLNLLENNGMSYFYSLANKAFDYVHAGIPSLNMNFPEYTKLNEEYEVFVLLDELTESAILNAISKLLEDSHCYNHLAANCEKAAKKWNWNIEQSTLLAIYEQCIAS